MIICGCGPTGAALSGYLGKLEVNNVVLEREPDITTDPRGIALDEDGIRILQGVGVYDHVFKEIGTCQFTNDTFLLYLVLNDENRYASVSIHKRNQA